MSKEIVYNNCYGGFSLSPEAEKRYLELSGKEAFFYEYKFTKPRSYIRIDNPSRNDMFLLTVTKDMGESTNHLPDDIYFSGRELNRKDPLLIQVIKELGSERASGRCAELAIDVIDDNEAFRITEYDGLETVETNSTIDWEY